MDSDLYLIPFFIHSVHAVFLSPFFIPPSPLGMAVEQMRKEHSIYTGLIYLINLLCFMLCSFLHKKGERNTSLDRCIIYAVFLSQVFIKQLTQCTCCVPSGQIISLLNFIKQDTRVNDLMNKQSKS
jgi:hypothetical protein